MKDKTYMETFSLNNEFLDLLFTHTMDMHLVVDQHRRVLYATPSFMETTGYNQEELKGIDIFELVHPEDLHYTTERHDHLLLYEENKTTEHRIISKNGEMKYFECKVIPLPGTENYLQVVSIRDTTPRRLMEMELEHRKNRYELLQQSLKSFSQDLSSVMKISELESRLLKELSEILPNSEPGMTVNSAEELHFKTLTMGKPETVDDRILIKIGEREGNAYILSLNTSSISEHMETIWLETFAYYAVMVFENLNVIENLMNQLETAISSNETPQWMLRLLFNLQEQQRMNLSSDLHDTVLQDQIDLYRRLESLLGREKLEKEIKGQLQGIEQGLLDTIHEIRAACNELRPPLLIELGLERSLENLFDHTQLSSTFKIDFTNRSTTSKSLNEEQTIGIYRIVQELLNNAAKHSRASILNFHMEKQEPFLKMIYIDNGVGFDRSKLSPAFNSMGLTGIAQRAQSLGGKVDFHSEPGKGLKVVLEIPIDERSLA